jgi:sugar lactone lactonase YvrE
VDENMTTGGRGPFEEGELQGVRLVAEGLVFPEGPVAMDDGTVLVVEMLAGRVSRITPSGTELVAETGGGPNGLADSGISEIDPESGATTLLRLPPWAADRLVTNICFGGPDLRTGFMTLSETGRLVACDWPRPGLELAFRA